MVMPPSHSSRSLIIARLGIGLAQGLALYLLYASADAHSWPATEKFLFAPLLLVALFTPIVLLMGAGNIRTQTLVAWAACTAIIAAGVAVYDIYRAGITDVWGLWEPIGPQNQRIIPSFIVIVLSAAGLFIAHSLIVAAETDHKPIATYPSYFDVAWKHALQLILSGPFVGIFWGLLFLGAGLFKLVKIDALWELIQHRWFAIPVTTIVLSGAIHITDVRVDIVRGIRTLKLTLLSSLLPLAALIGVGFLATLPFTGLAPLWGTRHGTGLLLAIEAVLIVLVNSAYQDGKAEHSPNRTMRFAGSVAALTLVPLVALTTYGLALRVGQYGWSTQRVVAAACTLVAACYGLGYAWASIARGAWLRFVEPCNVITAFVVLGVLLALLTPIADPNRLTVADQMARLRSGKITPQEFDFTYFRFYAGRYGQAALQELKENPPGAQADYIRTQAETALNKTSLFPAPFATPKPAVVAASVTMHPDNRVLPDSFVARDWVASLKQGQWMLPRCLTDAAVKCDGLFADLNGDGIEEIILVDRPTRFEQSPNIGFFKRQADDSWRFGGRIFIRQPCKRVIDALRTGDLKTVDSGWQDLLVGGMRLHLDPTGAEGQPNCD